MPINYEYPPGHEMADRFTPQKSYDAFQISERRNWVRIANRMCFSRGPLARFLRTLTEKRRKSRESRNPKNLRSPFTLSRTERVELVVRDLKINRPDSATRNWITSRAHEGTEGRRASVRFALHGGFFAGVAVAIKFGTFLFFLLRRFAAHIRGSGRFNDEGSVRSRNYARVCATILRWRLRVRIRT